MGDAGGRDVGSRSQPLAAALRRLRGRRWRIVPHPGPVDREQLPGRGKSGALRAAIFGVNDGLVSNLSLIFGVAGAGQKRSIILLAGFAGLLAGAFSMGAGEYISVRVQREVFERLLHLEAHEIGTDPEAERAELADIYRTKGISPELADKVSEELMRDPNVALDTHAREELGIDPQEGLGSPWAAAGSSFLMFCIGALVPLAPFLFRRGSTAAVLSALISGVSLFVVGALISRLTGKRFLTSGLRQLLVGALAASVTFLVGKLLGVAVA